MNEEKILQIKDALKTIMQMVVNRGQPLSPELKNQLAQVLLFAENRIQKLREEPKVQEYPELDPGPYPSSNVNSFKYDPNSKKLFVKFHGKETADGGPVYSYDNVPLFIFEVFRRGAVGPKTTGKNKYHAWYKGVTPSLGAAMNALIKQGGFSYQRLT